MGLFFLASNLRNRIKLYRRLPLVQDRADAIAFTNLPLFKVYVPSGAGGILQVGCDQADAVVAVSHPTPGKRLVDSTGAGATNVFTYRLKPGDHKWFYVTIQKYQVPYSVWSTFKEVGTARVSRAEAADVLIPWNFWYWPNARSREPLTAWGSRELQPCQKYEQAFGVGGVLKWEKDYHNDPQGTAGGWFGHCHNSAPASIAFEPPPPGGKSCGGQDFSCEELKFFATEYAGDYLGTTMEWWLPGAGAMMRGGPYHEEKPNNEPALFGQQAAKFHNTLVKTLLQNREAVVMDLRDSTGADHPSVWNQAVYMYESVMWEHPLENDEKLVMIRTDLHANEDFLPPDNSSSGSPADADASKKPPLAVPNGTGRDQQLLYILEYNDDGTTNVNSARNRWLSVTKSGSADELFAPRFVFKIDKRGQVSGDGNKALAKANILQLVQLRNRYK